MFFRNSRKKSLREVREAFESRWYFKLGLKQRRQVHAMLLPVVSLRRKLKGYKVRRVGPESISTDSRPLIFALNHVSKMDIEILSEVIKEHFTLLTNDFAGLHTRLDGHMISITGVVFFDAFDSSDARLAKEKLTVALKDGSNVMWCPEGDWNLSPNVLVLPLFWGMAEVAHASGALVQPLGIQVFGKEYHVKVGQAYDMREYLKGEEPLSVANKQAAMDDLRERLATLVWEILENRPRELRKHIPPFFYQDYVKRRLAEWPTNTQEKIESHHLTNRLKDKMNQDKRKSV